MFKKSGGFVSVKLMLFVARQRIYMILTENSNLRVPTNMKFTTFQCFLLQIFTNMCGIEVMSMCGPFATFGSARNTQRKARSSYPLDAPLPLSHAPTCDTCRVSFNKNNFVWWGAWCGVCKMSSINVAGGAVL